MGSSSRFSVSQHHNDDNNNDNVKYRVHKSEELPKPSSIRMPTSTPITNSSKNNNNNSKNLLQLEEVFVQPDHLSFQTWIDHSHGDFHNFTEKEATDIRSALLEWYTKNRRKLPWRGDPPPFDGSTMGINNKKKKKKKKIDNNQKPITSYFGKPRNSTRSKIKNEEKQIDVHQQRKRKKKSEEEEVVVAEVDNLDQEEEEIAISATGYGVWVSEIMLQQTRVETVIPYWIKWMKSFPTVHELAAATEEEVNSHWAGLGFYRRARFLHQGAKYVVKDLNGELPTTPQGLVKIQGIGPYTAAAIASIAFDVCVPVVDGNVCRVLSRLKGIANHIKHPILKDKLGWKLAGQIVEAGDGSSPGIINQALMELGATYCAPSGSGIDDRDPLKEYYLSTQLGKSYLATLQDCDNGKNGDELFTTLPPKKNSTSCEFCDQNGTQIIIDHFRDLISSDSIMEEAAKLGYCAFPTDPPKTEKREEDLAVAVILNHGNSGDDNGNDDTIRYLMVKRPNKGLLAGQWEFPRVSTVQKKNKKKNQTDTAKIPSKADRDPSLTNLLTADLFLDYSNDDIATTVSNLTRRAKKMPLEHVFSHVRHIMWIEVGYLDVDLGNDLKWTAPSGKNMRWMNKSDMQEVGITSGVKKILQSVDSSLYSDSKLKRKRQKKMS